MTSYIGASLPRSNAKRLLAGRGQYVDDVRLPRMLHAAFLRSPYAHARIARIDIAAAAAAPGVARVMTGADVAALCQPYVGVLAHIAGMRSALRYVRHSPALATLYGRCLVVYFSASAMWALLPVVARDQLLCPVAELRVEHPEQQALVAP